MISFFYLSIGIIGYTYIGYPFIVMLMSKVKNMGNQKKQPGTLTITHLPMVTVIIAAYNEAGCMEEKIRNTISLDYPSNKKKIIVVTDGSTDGTEKLVALFPEVVLMHQLPRQGKTAAINRALGIVEPGIVVFTDANAILNTASLKELMKHFEDRRTGAVAGEKKVVDRSGKGAVAVEGLYWKYESVIRQWDADLHSVPGAAGELFAVRSNLLQSLPQGIICDDLYLSLLIINKGYRIGYESNAYGMENYAYAISKEWKRKLRIAAGCIQILANMSFFNFLAKQPVPAFQFLSRKIIRWIIVPYLMLLLLVYCILFNNQATEVMGVLISLHWLFYAFALVGWAASSLKSLPRLFFFPFYFVFANAAMIIGTIHYFSGKSYAVWEKIR